MRERKKTAVHGTLEMTYMAVEFNFQQVLLKTLIPRMNTLKDTAVLNIRAGINPKVFLAIIFNFPHLCIKTLNSRTHIKKVGSARGDPWV